MQYLPKEWLDVATAIHWFEAILAAAAIVIWHFYGVIFDPDVYPLDTAFITGFSVREHDDPTPEGAVALSADPDPGVSPQSHGLTERPAS
jgi:hypothetical protein